MKFLKKIFIILVLSLSPYSAIAAKMSPEQLYQQGKVAFIDKDYKKALTLFEMAAQDGPFMLNDADMVCMMRHSANMTNNQDKNITYTRLCNKFRSSIKFSGKFDKVEQRPSESKKPDLQVCIKLNSGKVFCESYHAYTKISINNKVVYDGPYEDYCNANLYDKMKLVISDNFSKGKNMDLFIAYSDNTSVVQINVNDPGNNIPLYKKNSTDYDIINSKGEK